MQTFHCGQYQPAIDEAKKHALRSFPNEACGIIHTSGLYIPFQNKSPNPRDSFDCHDERLSFFMQNEIIAMLHSHPFDSGGIWTSTPKEYAPSAHDMAQQLGDDLPWGIICTDGKHVLEPFFWGRQVPIPPLLGRQFRHGASGSDGRGDCYALIKDYYKLILDVDLPEGIRNDEWWQHGENLYLENMTRAGFVNVPANEVKEHDVFFAQINSSVPNHGGLILKNGMLLHHLTNRLSREEPIIGWRKHIVRYIRHESQF